jgi:hypothetical protein
LQQALAEGRITVTELEERIAAVYAAIYPADLHRPLADLPGEPVVALPAAKAPAAVLTLELRTGAAGIKRSGDWTVPARIRVKGTMGSVALDFSKASIEPPIVEVELKLGSGSAQLVLPDDATANVDALVATMGTVKSTVESRPRAGAPHFIVRGRTRMGSVTVRRRRGFAGIRF